MRASVLLAVALAACASSTERVDPHGPGDRCFYSCPNGMRCAGTLFGKGRARPGQCELEPHRCWTITDCTGGETCARFGAEVGVCRPSPLQ